MTGIYRPIGFDPLANAGTPDAPASAAGLSTAGTVFAIGAALNNAVSAFYAAKTQKWQLRAAAAEADFQAEQGRQAAHDAEIEAQSILKAGQEAAGRRGLEHAQETGARNASTAAAGVRTTTGSAVEAQATADYAAAADRYAITVNTTRAAGATRMRGAAYRAGADFAGVNAQTLRRSARLTSPAASVATSLLGSAASVSSRWYRA